jgi:hypothetical protein
MKLTNASLRIAASTVPLLFLLGACATPKPPSTPSLDLINEHVRAAAAAQQELASVVAAEAAKPVRARESIVTDMVTIDFVGNIETVLSHIATQYGFEFEVLGKRPPEGLMVNIYVKQPKPVVDILRAISLEYPAMVDVNVTKTKIELVYKRS